MYCFIIKPTSEYAYGAALVAAHNVDEAIKTYCKDDFSDYMYDILKCTCNVVNGLHHDTETPKIIFNYISES